VREPFGKFCGQHRAQKKHGCKRAAPATCKHGKRRWECLECGNQGLVCKHGKRRKDCLECGNQELVCWHRKWDYCSTPKAERRTKFPYHVQPPVFRGVYVDRALLGRTSLGIVFSMPKAHAGTGPWVIEEGPAHKAGVQPGVVVLGYADKDLTSNSVSSSWSSRRVGVWTQPAAT
jgi:hypothetical protein